MGLLFGKRAADLDALIEASGGRIRSSTGVVAPTSRTQTLAASVKWACLRLRADLVSTTPVDNFRRVNGVQVEVAKAPFFSAPGGGSIEWEEWLYSSQFDLDDVGNTVGIITARNAFNQPSAVELVPIDSVVVRVRKGVVTYRIDGAEYTADEVWHERQFTTSGSPVGLSPTAFAAQAMAAHLGALQFAAEWFNGSGIPAAHFRNREATVTGAQSLEIKRRFDEQIRNGGTLVTGKDWEYHMLGAKASESAFVEGLKATAPDLCRFYGVPGDMVDVESSTGSITYANVTQRNLQLLVINLGPTFVRRERTFSSRLLPAPRFAKFNTDALLRMDPLARSQKLIAEVAGRITAPSEARALNNQQPFTEDQYAEFERLWPTRAPQTQQQAAQPSTVVLEQLAALAASRGDTHVHNTVPVSLPDIAVDARTEVQVDGPQVDARTQWAEGALSIDATTALLEDSIKVDARTTVTQSEPAVVEPTAIRKRVERGPDGAITQIIEEQVR